MKSCLCDIGDGHGQIPLKCKSKVLFGDWEERREERSGGIWNFEEWVGQLFLLFSWRAREPGRVRSFLYWGLLCTWESSWVSQEKVEEGRKMGFVHSNFPLGLNQRKECLPLGELLKIWLSWEFFPCFLGIFFFFFPISLFPFPSRYFLWPPFSPQPHRHWGEPFCPSREGSSTCCAADVLRGSLHPHCSDPDFQGSHMDPFCYSYLFQTGSNSTSNRCRWSDSFCMSVRDLGLLSLPFSHSFRNFLFWNSRVVCEKSWKCSPSWAAMEVARGLTTSRTMGEGKKKERERETWAWADATCPPAFHGTVLFLILDMP